MSLAVTYLSIRAPVWIKCSNLDHSCPHRHPLHHCGYICVSLKQGLVVIYI